MASALHEYLEETRRPIYSAVLVLPFLLVYQAGILIMRPTMINGGDAIIRRLTSAFPISSSLVSLLVLVICFVIWQMTTRAKMSINPEKLALLFAESVAFAFLLYWFNGWLAMMWSPHSIVAPASGAVLLQATEGGGGLQRHLLDLMLFCGAGVYEELVFRVFLLGLLMLVFTKLLQVEAVMAAVWTVLLGSVLFSLFHYGPGGDDFELNSFLQRAFSGVYFCTIYTTRCFGVAAAAHALYDIRVGFAQMT